jgi:hypothetical protein
MAKPTPITSTISTTLLSYLKDLYKVALKELVHSSNYTDGINGRTEHAIPAYIIAVAVVDAFVNEMFLGPIGWGFANKPKSEGFWKALERARLSDKLLFTPEFYFGQTFETDKVPYQDMSLLINLRNDLAHYKMDFKTPKPVKDLKQRGIALDSPGDPWVDCVSTTEGIRWAHNTVCQVLKEIIHFASDRHPLLLAYSDYDFFEPITEASTLKLIEQFLESKQVDQAKPNIDESLVDKSYKP